jgi:glycosyltransferase involved in cell wall biosynthesis
VKPSLRSLRVYHGGRDRSDQARERALTASGIDLALAVPVSWPETTRHVTDFSEKVQVFQFDVSRSGDVNRHAYRDLGEIKTVIARLELDVLDVHEEPFSVASRQWLAAAPPDLPVVMYTAQNVDKRFPPPFAQYEHAAYRRVSALYPCSSQAASVARGKGFAGLIDVLPLGFDDAVFTPGSQSADADEIVLAIAGRLVPEKGVADAVEILARVNATRPARLVVVGSGPEEAAARHRASALGVADRLEIVPWQPAAELAATYRSAHVVLVPSRPTETWVEQFGRVIVEAQASGAVVAGYASGAIPEIAGDAAILTAVGAASELADDLVALTADPAEYERRRQTGIALSRTRTWTQVAQRQAELYRRVAAGEVQRVQLPASPRRRREIARAEFGPTAQTIAGTRPFALPLLRRGGRLVSALAAALDVAAELSARARPRSVKPG